MPFEAIGKQLQGNWEDNSKAIGERLESNAIAKQWECYFNAFGKQLECGWKHLKINLNAIGMRLVNNWNVFG